MNCLFSLDIRLPYRVVNELERPYVGLLISKSVFKLHVSEDPTARGGNSKKSLFPVIFADYSISRTRHLGPEEQHVFRVAVVHPSLIRNCVPYPPTTEIRVALKSNVTIEHPSIVEGSIPYP